MYSSHNSRVEALYSDTIETYLQASRLSFDVNHDEQCLKRAVDWLKRNNPLVEEYIEKVIFDRNRRYPAMHCSDLTELRSTNRPDILMNDDAYDAETKNENFRHFRLSEKDDLRSFNDVIDKNHPNLKALIFPVLYFENHDHYQRLFDFRCSISKETLFKNAQRKLNMTVSHFRNDWYWSAWIYLKVEKRRIFQNSAKLMKDAKTRLKIERLTTSNIIKKNFYGAWSIIDENQTFVISAQLRTKSLYFQFAQVKINILTSTIDLSQLFLTLIFFEKWLKYQEILRSTDEKDITPNNRSWKTVQYYHFRWLSLKKYVLRDSKMFEFEELKKLIERQKFQNRDVIHTHNLLWTTILIEQLIAKNYIRTDMPNPEKKSKLHKLVSQHQIHTCRKNLCRKNLNDDIEICRKSFPASLSAITHRIDDDLRYTYKRITKTNRWISFYNSVILIIWKTHMNIQYCTSDDLTAYVNKYVTKPEPKKLYDTNENDQTLQSHLMTRRMKSMKIMMLLLSYDIFRCTREIRYLITARSDERSAQIKSAWMLLQKQIEDVDSNPFYRDIIEKYFDKPINEKFNDLTYFKYYADYKIDVFKEEPLTNDEKQSFKRRKSMLIQTTQRRLCDDDAFFYDRLLHIHSWRSKVEILEITSTDEVFSTYRDHFVTRWSAEYIKLQKWHTSKTKISKIETNNSFFETFEKIVSINSKKQNQMIRDRLQHMRANLKRSLTNTTVLDLKEKQLTTYNYITTQFLFHVIRESRDATFFVTEKRKTNKSFLLSSLKNWLMRHNWSYVKTAPTDIAVNHIDDKTLHSSFEIANKNDSSASYRSCVMQNNEMYEKVKVYRALIIDEISMISDELFSFLSELLARMHQNIYSFEDIHVIVFENLMQLSSVTERQVFHASQWRYLTSMFLIRLHRHDKNSKFDKMLKTIRMNNVTNEIMTTLLKRYHEFNVQSLTNRSTTLMSLKIKIKELNKLMLKRCCSDVSYEHKAVNRQQKRILMKNSHLKQFKKKINLSQTITVVKEAKIMFLNNTKIRREISNESCDLIIKIDEDEHSVVTFSKADDIEIITCVKRLHVSLIYVHRNCVSNR